jgi:predicted Kef-type K+ transport protein
MLFDPRIFVMNPASSSVVGIIIGKSGVVASIDIALSVEHRIGVAASLGQLVISFILAGLGMSLGCYHHKG